MTGYYVVSIDTPTDNLRGFAAALTRLGEEFPESLATLPGGELELTITEQEIAALKQADEELYAAQREEGVARGAKNDALAEARPEFLDLRRKMNLRTRFESSASGVLAERLEGFSAVVRSATLATQLEELVKVALAIDPLDRPGYGDARLAELSLLAGALREAQDQFADATAHRRSVKLRHQEARLALLRRVQRLDAFLGEELPPDGLTKLKSQRQTWLKRVSPAKPSSKPEDGEA